MSATAIAVDFSGLFMALQPGVNVATLLLHPLLVARFVVVLAIIAATCTALRGVLGHIEIVQVCSSFGN